MSYDVLLMEPDPADDDACEAHPCATVNVSH